MAPPARSTSLPWCRSLRCGCRWRYWGCSAFGDVIAFVRPGVDHRPDRTGSLRFDDLRSGPRRQRFVSGLATAGAVDLQGAERLPPPTEEQFRLALRELAAACEALSRSRATVLESQGGGAPEG